MSDVLTDSPSESPRLPARWVDKIFKRLHGKYGNQFLDKFSTGEKLANGLDAGIENAKAVWADELVGLRIEQIKQGLAAQYQFPPSCDEFKAATKINAEKYWRDRNEAARRALPPPGRTTASQDKVKQHIAKLAELMGQKRKGVDVSWAVAILEGKARVVTQTSKDMALRALNEVGFDMSSINCVV